VRYLSADARIRLTMLTLLGVALAGCAGTQTGNTPSNQPGEIRNTTETAPADLQLTCSSAAANQFGLPPNKVLPTASSKLSDGTYNVQLMADGQNYVCQIDENARVLGVTPT